MPAINRRSLCRPKARVRRKRAQRTKRFILVVPSDPQRPIAVTVSADAVMFRQHYSREPVQISLLDVYQIAKERQVAA